MKLRVINKDRLCYLFDNIQVINYWIKRIDTGITKSAFYNIKRHLIYYIILLIKRRKYDNENVTYCINEINKHIINGNQEQMLISLSINIDNKEYKFHQVLRTELHELLKDEIGKDNTIKCDYKESEEIFPNEDVNSIQNRYISIINQLCILNWSIYRPLSNSAFVNIIKKRYNLYGGIMGRLTLLDRKREYVSLRPNKKIKNVQIDLNELRYNTNDLLRHLYKKELKLNYNINEKN